MGLPNVVSLKNGTSGWVLAGLDLEHGASRLELPEPTPEGRARAETFAAQVAREDGVRMLGIDDLRALAGRSGQQPVYLSDVRTEREYAEGHIPGIWSFPGGQAVQRADDAVAVRDGQVVFCCDGIVRAAVTASWYRQMGFPNVYAVDGGVRAWAAHGLPLERGPNEVEPFGLAEARARVATVTPEALSVAMSSERRPTVIFVDTSREFALGHVPGARWLQRGWLEFRIAELAPDQGTPIVVSDADGRNALLSGATLRNLGYQNVSALAGGMDAWRGAGLPVETGLAGVMAPPDDVVPMGPNRTHADMIQYLRWEEALGKKYET